MTRFMHTVASHSNDPTRVPAPPPTSAHDELGALALLQATSLPFLIAATAIGREMGVLDPAVAVALLPGAAVPVAP
jgi:hypothetical protein